MEACRVYSDSHLTNVLIKNETLPCSSEVLDSLWVPNSSPSFHGSAAMVKFENENNSEMPFVTKLDTKVDNCNEDFDGSFHQPEKKRRLFPDQVQFLEKSFELENKLEPERKTRLAKQLGLQPRQVAIWFQNRRARNRTKQLEKDYDVLKASYEKLKQECDAIFKHNEKLKNEVQLLTGKLLLKENGKKSKQEQCEPISPTMDLQPMNPISDSSVKSDVFDSDSRRYAADGEPLERADSSRVASDISQDEDDDSLSKYLLLAPSIFPKLEVDCCDDLQPNSCSFGFPVQDQGTWFWQYR